MARRSGEVAESEVAAAADVEVSPAGRANPVIEPKGAIDELSANDSRTVEAHGGPADGVAIEWRHDAREVATGTEIGAAIAGGEEGSIGRVTGGEDVAFDAVAGGGSEVCRGGERGLAAIEELVELGGVLVNEEHHSL